MSEFSSSDQLKSLHSSFTDSHTDIEANILRKGQEVEQFIISHQNDENKSVSFSFLQTLFSLFKSEFLTNLQLRKEIIDRRNIFDANQIYLNEKNFFIQKFQFDFPNLCNELNSLDDISNFSKKLFYQLNKYTKTNATKQNLQQLIQQKRDLLQRNNLIKQESLTIAKSGELKIIEEQKFLENLKINQKNMEEKVKFLFNEKSELEKVSKSFSNIEELKMKIKAIDQKVVTIVSNMTTMKSKFRRKIEKTKIKIEKYQVDVKELKSNRIELEKELDSVQSKIDYLTNPLGIPNKSIEDESIEYLNGHPEISKDDHLMESPHAERFKLIELHKRFDALSSQLKEDTTSIEQIDSKLEELSKYIVDSNQKIRENKALIEKLNVLYADQQNLFQFMNSNKDKISLLKDQIKFLGENKKSLYFDKIKLNRQLDEIQSKYDRLALDYKSNKKTDLFLENRKKKSLEDLNQFTLSDYDKEMFESVMETMRRLREELFLSINSSPKDIVDIVVRHFNST